MEDEFIADIHIRYNDLDTYNHVNNAVYGTYLEEARIAYLEEAVGISLEDVSFVIAGLELSFERPVTMGEDLVVAVETTALGRSSLTMAYDLRVDLETVATGETTAVFIDPEEKRPASIPSEIRERVLEVDGEGLEDPSADERPDH